MTEIFKNDDAGYERWLEAHPQGFVVNSRRRPTPSYLKLHSARCKAISRLQPQATTWTSGDYIKVCSAGVEGLREWARTSTGGSLDDGCPCSW